MLDSRQCRATSKRSGERCRRAAIVGGSVCKFHGGAAPQVVHAARRRVAQADALRLLGTEVAVVPVTDPIGALALLAGEVEALRAILRDQLAQLESAETSGRTGFDNITTLIGLYNDTVGRAQRVLTALARLDISDRTVTVDERTARGVVLAVTATIRGFGIEATHEQVADLMAINLRAARVAVGGFELSS